MINCTIRLLITIRLNNDYNNNDTITNDITNDLDMILGSCLVGHRIPLKKKYGKVWITLNHLINGNGGVIR